MRTLSSFRTRRIRGATEKEICLLFSHMLTRSSLEFAHREVSEERTPSRLTAYSRVPREKYVTDFYASLLCCTLLNSLHDAITECRTFISASLIAAGDGISQLHAGNLRDLVKPDFASRLIHAKRNRFGNFAEITPDISVDVMVVSRNLTELKSANVIVHLCTFDSSSAPYRITSIVN